MVINRSPSIIEANQNTDHIQPRWSSIPSTKVQQTPTSTFHQPGMKYYYYTSTHNSTADFTYHIQQEWVPLPRAAAAERADDDDAGADTDQNVWSVIVIDLTQLHVHVQLHFGPDT